MQRLMIGPFEFGSLSGYDFLNSTNPFASIQVNPHVNYDDGMAAFERSFRVWEPGRMALSSMGVPNDDPTGQFTVPQIPQGCKIHGIKGSVVITPARVAEFYNLIDGTRLDPQPEYDQVFDGSNVDGPIYGVQNQSLVVYNGNLPTLTPSHYAGFPMFITMCKGTFMPLGGTNAEGGSIDSGPNDDPDTLIGLDFTNPSLLESESRVAWWDMEMFTMPHRDREFTSVVRDIDDLTGVVQHGRRHGPYRKYRKEYRINLSQNWVVRDDQVLWLTFTPGVVNTGVTYLDPILGPVNLGYRGACNYDVIASMLVSLHTPGV